MHQTPHVWAIFYSFYQMKTEQFQWINLLLSDAVFLDFFTAIPAYTKLLLVSYICWLVSSGDVTVAEHVLKLKFYWYLSTYRLQFYNWLSCIYTIMLLLLVYSEPSLLYPSCGYIDLCFDVIFSLQLLALWWLTGNVCLIDLFLDKHLYFI